MFGGLVWWDSKIWTRSGAQLCRLNKTVSVVTRCRPPEITDGKDIELIGCTSLCTHTHTHLQAGLWHGTLDICETTHTLTSDLLLRPPSSRHSLLRHVSREPVDVPNTHIHQVHAHISKHARTSTPHSIITNDWALVKENTTLPQEACSI